MAHSALDYALTQVFQTIPLEILELSFQSGNQYRTLGIPVHQLIIEKVIHYRVLKDCSLFGGKTKLIPLKHEFMEDVPVEMSDRLMGLGRYTLYRIPLIERENVPITEVNSCHYPGYINAWPGHHPAMGGSNLANLAYGVLDSHTFASSPQTPLPELLSGDLIRLNPPQHRHLDWVISCRLGYDEQLTNLNVSAIKPFAELVEHAVKSYIYNTLIVKLDRAYVAGGVEIGTVLRIVENYAESENRYRELLDQFSGSTKLDPMSMRTILNYAL